MLLNYFPQLWFNHAATTEGKRTVCIEPDLATDGQVGSKQGHHLQWDTSLEIHNLGYAVLGSSTVCLSIATALDAFNKKLISLNCQALSAQV